MTDARLMRFVDRIENIEEDERETRKGKREVYDEAKDAQYNTKALRKIIAERRMKDRQEITDAMDGYRVALGMAAKAVADGMSLDDAKEAYGFSRSAIHRAASHCEENALSGTAREMTADDLGQYEVPPAATHTEREGPNAGLSSSTWQQITLARDLFEAEREYAKEAERNRRRAEREALAAKNAVIDADPLDIPPFLRRVA